MDSCAGQNSSQAAAVRPGGMTELFAERVEVAVGNVRRGNGPAGLRWRPPLTVEPGNPAWERIPVTTASSTPQTVNYSGADGITLVADEWNRGSHAVAERPTIVMLHGGGQNRFSWKNT